ncbi:glycosyltransferase family 4 protein [Nocardiopsis tropica]|uniref:glycosyltransferase family 4 protein n=1 Tax=Nocardiopsis tropica TaxID=109330 RepID=UPI002E8BF9B9|nr:glycosyltransferase family 4 protein [Nocardiopsis tropica]
MRHSFAFVLLSYAPDVAAGMERATAGLAHGLTQTGHDAVIITAAQVPDPLPGVERLRSLSLPGSGEDEHLRRAIVENQDAVHRELGAVFTAHRVDTVVYVDALWGMGRAMAEHPARHVLAVHVVGHDEDLAPALAAADAVIAPSPTVLRQATERGYRTGDWKVVPNSLHWESPSALSPARVEERRTRGPVRVLARLGPEKGVDRLLAAPAPRGHRIDIALAPAPFASSGGAQQRLLDTCRCLADRQPQVRVVGGVPWERVPVWLGQAGVVVVPSLQETFGLVALEAMSVGVPVVAHDVDHLPDLIGAEESAGGVLVPLGRGAEGLWEAARDLLANPVTYRARAQAAYYRARDFRPSAVAESCLKAVPR